MSTPAAQEILKMAGLKGQAGGATSSSAPAPSARSRSPPVGAAASSLQHRPRSRSRSARRALQHRDAQRNLLSQLAGVLNSAYEEELKLDAFRPKIWLSYIDSAVNPKTHSLHLKWMMYERALRMLPRSYKIWRKYLEERRKALERNDYVERSQYEEMNGVYERALVFLHKMPRIWIDYLQFLQAQKRVTGVRRALDQAVRTLPIHQHYRLWNEVIPWLQVSYVPRATCLNLFRRYLMLEPGHVETFIAYLTQQGLYDEAAVRLVEVLNQEDFVSINGKSNHQLWMDLCQLVSQHPKDIKSLNIEPIIRQGISKFTDEVGRLWISLADHYIRLGWFDKARATYQEAIEKIATAHDFSLVYESYQVFLTNLVEITDADDALGVDLQFAVLEDLIDQRPLLLSSVLLRQNPNVVQEWIKRCQIFEERNELEMVVKTYKEACATVDPDKVIGKFHELWISFAHFFERQDAPDMENVRDLFETATVQRFAHADDTASLWCEWIEMELRYANTAEALELGRRCISRPLDTSNSAAMKAMRSKKLWYLSLDLEAQFGTFETTKATYERMLDLKLATPQIVLNFAVFLEDHKHFEASFKAFEKGVALFKQPHCHDLWLFYLVKFMHRYKSRKVERARDLFEEAIRACSESESMMMRLHVLYGKLEERYGLARKALQIYQQGVEKITKDKDLQRKMWTLLLVRTGEIKGGNAARAVLNAAVNKMPEGDGLVHFGLLYSELETSFGELERARKVYQHVCQFCDPRRYPKFWEIWQLFEMRHGNAETFKEMRRIQRSVEAAYAQIHFNAPDISGQLDELKDNNLSLNPEEEARKKLEEEEGKEGAKKTKQGKEDKAWTAKRNRLLEDLGVNQRERDAYFEPCDKFLGGRLGYVFKTGIKGLGYYEDTVGAANLMSRTGIIAKSAQVDAAPDDDIGKADAEIDLDLDSDEDEEAPAEPVAKKPKTALDDTEVQERALPSTLFGSAAGDYERLKREEKEKEAEALENIENEEKKAAQAAVAELAKKKAPARKQNTLDKFRKKPRDAEM